MKPIQLCGTEFDIFELLRLLFCLKLRRIIWDKYQWQSQIRPYPSPLA